LSLASRIKLQVRDEPVFPRDFLLLKEALAARMAAYHIRWPWAVIHASFSVFMVNGEILRRGSSAASPFRWSRCGAAKPGKRLAGFWPSQAVLVALLFTVYASNSLYNSFPSPTPTRSPPCSMSWAFPTASATVLPPIRWTSPDGFRKSPRRKSLGDRRR
jgi:hypothetical protein